MTRPTLRDVAARAGVSVSTVSHALNDRSTLSLSDETKKRVQRIARELGYVPNGLARSLRSHESGTVGMILGKPLTSARYAAIAEGLAAGLRSHGLHLAVIDEPNSSQAVDDVRGRKLDGIVFIGHDDQGVPTELARAVGDHEVPFVAVDCSPGDDPPYATVDFDYGRGVEEAFADFEQHGVRTVVYLRPEIRSRAEQIRTTAISEQSQTRPAMTVIPLTSGVTVELLAGLDADSSLRSPRARALATRVEEALAGAAIDLAATAVLCAWGADAEAAYRAAASLSESPRVTALAPGSLSAELWPGLTYSRLPLERAGREGARLILAAIRGDRVAERVVLAPEPLHPEKTETSEGSR